LPRLNKFLAEKFILRNRPKDDFCKNNKKVFYGLTLLIFITVRMLMRTVGMLFFMKMSSKYIRVGSTSLVLCLNS